LIILFGTISNQTASDACGLICTALSELFTLLSQIHSPDELKELTRSQLTELAAEIREAIVSVTHKNGGHLSSNLGIVELTIALHRAFDSPRDSIVFDVSHQCYAHKLLTGRYGRFGTLRARGGISGFTKTEESAHDFFDWGHASTSISAGLGMLIGKAMTGKDGKVVAVIGDGSLTGGMAYEALSHAGQLNRGLIVVLNDNQLSISPNTGSVSKHLSRLTATPHYQTFRDVVDKIVDHIPLFNRHLRKFIFRLKRGLKGLLLTNNLFSDLGFEYVGALDGHNIAELEAVFKRVKKLKVPVVVHVVTKKGRGFSPAEKDPVAFHSVAASRSAPPSADFALTDVSFSAAFSRSILDLAAAHPNLAAVTAAMEKGTGLSAFCQNYPERFFDVGIAEEHAVSFAAGLAKQGVVPIVAIYSTFMQRAIDQVIHDVALQNLPVVFVVDRAGAVPDDGETHQGIFDIALMLGIPNMTLLAPASAAERALCLRWAVQRGTPVSIRYPKSNCPREYPPFELPLEEGRGTLLRAADYGADAKIDVDKADSTLIVCAGGIFPEARAAAAILLREGLNVDIYNLRFLKPLDEAWFLNIADGYRAIVLVEDGAVLGGVARHLELLLRKNLKSASVAALGFPDRFMAQGSRAEILEDAGLSPDAIASCVRHLVS
jgi:1-deoxy-D-xylulose-5-phosphate synthase